MGRGGGAPPSKGVRCIDLENVKILCQYVRSLRLTSSHCFCHSLCNCTCRKVRGIIPFGRNVRDQYAPTPWLEFL